MGRKDAFRGQSLTNSVHNLDAQHYRRGAAERRRTTVNRYKGKPMSAGPVPMPIPESREYWEGALRGELRIPECGSCGRVFFYPRAYCPFCSSADIGWKTASGKATLASYVINRRPAPNFESDAPQVIALVTLEEGIQLMTNIVDVEPTSEALPLGLELEVQFAQRGDQALPVFAPKKGK